MYGRGEKSIAEQLGCSVEEAKSIKDNVYDAFPKIKTFERSSSLMVKSNGYVTTLWGRKRRLPDYNLPNYEFYYVDNNGNKLDMPVPKEIVDEYLKLGFSSISLRSLTPLGCALKRWKEIGYTPMEFLTFYRQMTL